MPGMLSRTGAEPVATRMWRAFSTRSPTRTVCAPSMRAVPSTSATPEPSSIWRYTVSSRAVSFAFASAQRAISKAGSPSMRQP